MATAIFLLKQEVVITSDVAHFAVKWTQIDWKKEKKQEKNVFQ
jgi:hypothetical protein